MAWPLAHHTLIMAPLFAGPVIILALALLVATWRDRRRDGGADG